MRIISTKILMLSIKTLPKETKCIMNIPKFTQRMNIATNCPAFTPILECFFNLAIEIRNVVPKRCFPKESFEVAFEGTTMEVP